MKRVLLTLAGALASLALTHCNSATSEQKAPQVDSDRRTPQAPAPEEEQDKSFKIAFEANCLIERDQCKGGYRFTVLSDHRFEIGPSPGAPEQVWRGQLPNEDFDELTRAMGTLLTGVRIDLESQPACVRGEDRGAQDKIVLARSGEEGEIVQVRGAELCHRAGSAEDARRIHETFRKIVLKHYPIPFPNRCLDAALEVEKQYAPLTSCQTDADCAYVDTMYAPIDPAEDMKAFFVDDCTWIRPLPVANRALLTGAAQETLQKAREEAQKACGDDLVRRSCAKVFVGLQPRLPAVCSAGTCRIHPKLY